MNIDRRDQPSRLKTGNNQPSGYGGGYGSRDNRNREGYNRSNDGNYQRGGRFNQGNRPNPRPKKKFSKPQPPKRENKIYFIALLPTAEAGKEIIRLKQEFAEKYGARHAVKVMPHITLQVPFTADPLLEKTITGELTDFAATLSPFEVTLNGFGAYPHKEQKVLYINVEKGAAIMETHRKLMSFLRKEFAFSNMLARDNFTPHITVAFKDLTPEQFQAAWPEYEHRSFRLSFKVNNLYFLRHNGVSWEVLHKCRLGGS